MPASPECSCSYANRRSVPGMPFLLGLRAIFWLEISLLTYLQPCHSTSNTVVGLPLSSWLQRKHRNHYVQWAAKRRYEDAYRHHMTRKTFTLIAQVSTENPRAVKSVLQELVPKKSIMQTDEGFLVKATMQGEGARELNRTLLTALRRVERKTRLRSVWKTGGTTERFFDYVPKGSPKA
jgi:hypothetical protein